MALLQISEPGKSQNPHEKKFCIGIDLGTTNSLVSVMRNGFPFVLKNNQENELFPSIVTYREDSVIVGDYKSDDESITFRSIKRFIGKNVKDLKKEDFYSPCEYFEKNNIIRFKVFNNVFSPIQILTSYKFKRTT